MKLRYKVLIGLVLSAIAASAAGYWFFTTRDSREPSLIAWNEHCASCHGKALEGTDKGVAMIDGKLQHGDTVEQMMGVIAKGLPDSTMVGWEGKLSPEQIKGLALYVSERRQKYPTIDDSFAANPETDSIIQSKHHKFRLEKITDLASRPYSLAPMPGGNILISEPVRGLSVVGQQGTQSELIEGTPELWGSLIRLGNSWLNLGTVLDVELHPDFEDNGWIYLSHTDRCTWRCGWIVPGTMVRVVRGRIKEGQWVDQQVIWSVHRQHYTPVPDAVAAGRLAFDRQSYLYISIGGKNTYGKLHDLNTPFGKVHRVRDDGSIPEDNPFYKSPENRPETSTIHTVWSYGHRTGQGLDGHPENGGIWNSEMGPRGGDEINHILGGENYGWPLYTNGLDYDGNQVSIGKDLGLNFALEDTVLPIVDFTPAPAVSNFAFHHGTQFSNWNNDFLVGSLKAKTLYRVRIENGVEIEREKLITNFGRIRDVAMGIDGLIYIVIEHGDNGSLWRMVPE